MGEGLNIFNFSMEYENNKKHYKSIYGDQFYFRNTIYGFSMPIWKAEEMAFMKTMSDYSKSMNRT